MNLAREHFGDLPDGRSVEVFSLSNAAGCSLRCMNYGATLVSVRTPDRSGKSAEITLGYDRLADYAAGHPFFGSSVGRVCNRIRGAAFTLGDQEFRLPANDRGNTLHGGPAGFHAQLWDAEPFQGEDRAGVWFHRVSPDGEMGFPGNLDVTISITLTSANEIEFEYRAETDRTTPVNLTNHAYWNLAGAPDLRPDHGVERSGGDIGRHVVTIHGNRIIDVDAASIPTGTLPPVDDSPFDFTEPMEIGARIDDVPGGYDHCYILSSDPDSNGLRPAADVSEPVSGRRMQVLTTLPAMQFYSGNKLDGTKSRADEPYRRHDAFCVETQLHVDAVNRPEFPSCILEPGATFAHLTVHRFMS